MTKKKETVAEKAKEIEKEIAVATEKVADELQIGLPEKKDVLFGVRLVILASLLGGVAILGNVFADNYTFREVDLAYYFFRIVIGMFLVFIAYTLHKKMSAGLWLFGLAAIISMVSNPTIGIFPVIALLYLYHHRDRFKVKRKVTIGKIKFEI